jgi:hypothetical protein
MPAMKAKNSEVPPAIVLAQQVLETLHSQRTDLQQIVNNPTLPQKARKDAARGLSQIALVLLDVENGLYSQILELLEQDAPKFEKACKEVQEALKGLNNIKRRIEWLTKLVQAIQKVVGGISGG